MPQLRSTMASSHLHSATAYHLQTPDSRSPIHRYQYHPIDITYCIVPVSYPEEKRKEEIPYLQVRYRARPLREIPRPPTPSIHIIILANSAQACSSQKWKQQDVINQIHGCTYHRRSSHNIYHNQGNSSQQIKIYESFVINGTKTCQNNHVRTKAFPSTGSYGRRVNHE